jgi:hypothetical protein
MKQRTIDFLIEKYGNRLDFPQPIIHTDSLTLQNQLALVDNQIRKSKNVGLLWTVPGVVWLMMCIVTWITEPVDAIKIFQVAVGVVYFISGLVYLNRFAELKRKKVILETILIAAQHP